MPSDKLAMTILLMHLFPSSTNRPGSQNTQQPLSTIFFTNQAQKSSIINGILTCDLSDHFPITYIFFSDKNPKVVDEFRFKRTINETTRKKFKQDVNDSNWSHIIEDNDPQTSYSQFHKQLGDISEKNFPLKKVKIGYINKLPWVTLALKNSICNKHKLYVKFLKHPNKFNEDEYKKFKNRLSHVMRTAERNYIQTSLEKAQHNLRKSGEVIKNVINQQKNRK